MEDDSTGESLAPKRIYTRRNPDPNPPKVVEDLEKILRTSNNNANKGIFHLQKSLSLLAKGVKSIVDIILDEKFDKRLLRSKSASDLNQVTFSPGRLIFAKSAQQPSQPPSISVSSQKQATQNAHTPVTYSPTLVIPPLVYIPIVPAHSVIFPNSPGAMAARFTPLVLPA